MDAGTLVPPGQNQATESRLATAKPAFFGQKPHFLPFQAHFFLTERSHRAGAKPRLSLNFKTPSI
jgi:hypothetical protein